MPIIDHLREFAPDLEKYKAVYIFHVKEDRNHDYNFSVTLFLELKLL
jgi:hypothetical protein